MALTAELEDLIKELEAVDPAGAKEQRALLERYPTLQKTTQEQRLRQSDYSKKQEELTEKRKGYDEHEAWFKEAKPAFDARTKERDDALAENTKLKTEQDKKIKEAVAAATAAAGGDPSNPMTADKITEAVIAKLGEQIVSPAKLAELVSAEAKKQTDEARKQFFGETVPQSLKFQSEFTDAQLRFFKETGDILDREKFAKFITERNYTSPEKAFEEFMKPERQKKEIDKLAEERYQALLKERSMEGVPGSSGPPTPPGPMQIRLHKKDPNDALFSGRGDLGDNSAAAAAAAELNAEGKK